MPNSGHAHETRQTLILRVHDSQDADAWNQFVEIYEPLVLRLARRLGLREADALDATQEVLLHLTKVVSQWQPNSDRGSFRGWLYRVARNVMLRQIERGEKQVVATGISGRDAMLEQLPEDPRTQEFDLEFRRQVFAWATGRVRCEFSDTSWQVFWRTFVEHEPISDAADDLGLSTGAAYIARSRVLKRIRELVQRQINEDWPDMGIDMSEPWSS